MLAVDVPLQLMKEDRLFYTLRELWLTTCTHSMRGSLTAMFPDKLTTQAGVSGVASSRAMTASTPILLAWIKTVKKQAFGEPGTPGHFFALLTRNENNVLVHRRMGLYYQDSVKGRRGSSSLDMAQDSGTGVKAKLLWDHLDGDFDWWKACMWCCIEATLPLLTCLTCSHVIGLPLRSMAPSATMIIFSRDPRPLVWKRQRKPLRSINRLFLSKSDSFEPAKMMHDETITSCSLLHRCSSHPSSGGISGMSTQSAPQARAVTKARYLSGTKRKSQARVQVAPAKLTALTILI